MKWIPEDIYSLVLPGQPALSVDGELVATVAVSDKGRDTVVQKLWLFPRSGPERPFAKDLMDAGSSESMPTWSPDGSNLAFISISNDYLSVVSATSAGEDVKYLWTLQNCNVSVLAWSDRNTLVFASQPKRKVEADPEIIDWLQYKHEGLSAGADENSFLWQVSLGGNPSILETNLGRVTASYADDQNLTIATELVKSDTANPSSTIIRLDFSDNKIREITKINASLTSVATHQNNIYLASTAATKGVPLTPKLWKLTEKGDLYEIFPLMHWPIGYGVIGEYHCPGAVQTLQVFGDKLIFAATLQGDNALFIGDPKTGATDRITPRGVSVEDFAVGGGRIVGLLESPWHPVELYEMTGDINKVETQLLHTEISHFNDALLEHKTTFEFHEVNSNSNLGPHTPGFIYKTKEPKGVIVRIHGGPHLSWGTTFDLESLIYNSEGYQVLMPNLIGSSGYGDNWWNSSTNNWGSRDFDDLIHFVEEVSVWNQLPHFIAGGSYGGFLVNWTVAHTHKFAAAVSERSISNFLSKFGTSDNGYITNLTEMAGLDVLDRTAIDLWDRSPLAWVSNINTPILLIHGDKDARCPIEQSEQLFLALRRLNQEAVLVKFRGEGHSLPKSGTPKHRAGRLRLILNWWEKHLAVSHSS